MENSTCLKNVLTAGLPDMGFFQGVVWTFMEKHVKKNALKLLDRGWTSGKGRGTG